MAPAHAAAVPAAVESKSNPHSPAEWLDPTLAAIDSDAAAAAGIATRLESLSSDAAAVAAAAGTAAPSAAAVVATAAFGAIAIE